MAGRSPLTYRTRRGGGNEDLLGGTPLVGECRGGEAAAYISGPHARSGRIETPRPLDQRPKSWVVGHREVLQIGVGSDRGQGGHRPSVERHYQGLTAHLPRVAGQRVSGLVQLDRSHSRSTPSPPIHT